MGYSVGLEGEFILNKDLTPDVKSQLIISQLNNWDSNKTGSSIIPVNNEKWYTFMQDLYNLITYLNSNGYILNGSVTVFYERNYGMDRHKQGEIIVKDNIICIHFRPRNDGDIFWFDCKYHTEENQEDTKEYIMPYLLESSNVKQSVNVQRKLYWAGLGYRDYAKVIYLAHLKSSETPSCIIRYVPIPFHWKLPNDSSLSDLSRCSQFEGDRDSKLHIAVAVEFEKLPTKFNSQPRSRSGSLTN